MLRKLLNSFWMDLLLIALVWLLILVVSGAAGVAGGCAPRAVPASRADSLPATAAGMERTGAHVESAERLNRAAKPLAGAGARPLMDQVSEEHGAALSSLADVRGDLKAAQDQRARLAGDNAKLAAQLAHVTGGWGYRFQLWATRLAWLLLGLTVAHFALGAAALFIPGPAGEILARVGVLLNPAAWFQSARDNYFFRVREKA